MTAVTHVVADSLRATENVLLPGTITLPWDAMFTLFVFASVGVVACVWTISDWVLERRERRSQRRMVERWVRRTEQEALREADRLQRQARPVDLRSWH